MFGVLHVSVIFDLIHVSHKPGVQSQGLARALRERLRTHKVFTKGHCFYLNYHKFSIKSYVLDVY